MADLQSAAGHYIIQVSVAVVVAERETLTARSDKRPTAKNPSKIFHPRQKSLHPPRGRAYWPDGQAHNVFDSRSGCEDGCAVVRPLARAFSC